ncbi:MAG: nitroreductase family protein [Lachnospiraceae bacterium]
MDFATLIKKRYSVRGYLDRPVEKNKLDMVLDAARIAPSAANIQPLHFLVITSESGLARVSKTSNIYDAPCAVIVCLDTKKNWTRSYDKKASGEEDAGIAIDHMMLQATDIGLGSVCINYFDPEKLRTEFSLPKGIEPISILALGYASDTTTQQTNRFIDRKDLEEIVHREQY